MKKCSMTIVLIIASVIISLHCSAVGYTGDSRLAQHETQPGYFITPAPLVPDPAISVSFTDVPKSHWAYPYIAECIDKGWFEGYDDNSFKPENTILRCEAVKVDLNIRGLMPLAADDPTFADVDSKAWYYPYIETGKNLLLHDTGKNGELLFKPEEPITREDTVYMIVNQMGFNKYLASARESKLSNFKDSSQISPNLRLYMAVAIQYRIIEGYDEGTLAPKGTLTRAEFATLLARAELLKK